MASTYNNMTKRELEDRLKALEAHSKHIKTLLGKESTSEEKPSAGFLTTVFSSVTSAIAPTSTPKTVNVKTTCDQSARGAAEAPRLKADSASASVSEPDSKEAAKAAAAREKAAAAAAKEAKEAEKAKAVAEKAAAKEAAAAAKEAEKAKAAAEKAAAKEAAASAKEAAKAIAAAQKAAAKAAAEQEKSATELREANRLKEKLAREAAGASVKKGVTVEYDDGLARTSARKINATKPVIIAVLRKNGIECSEKDNVPRLSALAEHHCLIRKCEEEQKKLNK